MQQIALIAYANILHIALLASVLKLHLSAVLYKGDIEPLHFILTLPELASFSQ